MDLKSFYRKIDVDSIKNRLPPLPQIKIPKIKSRKIFKSSREDISQQQQQQQPPSSSGMVGGPPLTPQSLPPPSAFIDRTPTRISTVSSLMNINYGFRDKSPPMTTTYRTANNYEAENCPDRPEENGETASAGGNAASRFGDRCRKTYKDFSEFRIKNIFAKKTVVKKTEIEVDMYARQYQEELQEELELEDETGERDYQFEFKEARRLMSRSSDSISPPDSVASGVPSPIRSELGRLQRSITPPLLAKRRNAIDEPGPSRVHMQRTMSDESEREPPKKPNRSSLWGLNERGSTEEAGGQTMYRAGISKLGALRKSRKEGASSEVGTAHTESVWKLKSIRARFASDDSGAEDKPKKSMHTQETIDESSDHEKKSWKLSNIHLRHTERHAEASDKKHVTQASSPEGKFSSIKESIQRLKQRKQRQDASEDSDHEQGEDTTTSRANVSDQLKAGLRRLRLKERSFSFDEDETTKPPQATATTNKLRNWKKSFKVKRPSESATDDEAPSKPVSPPPGRSATLMRKLNHIRTRKVGSEEEEESVDPSQGDDQQKPKSSNFEKLEQARHKALRKVNAQVQKMKMFHGKSRDSPGESSPEKPQRTNQKKLDSEGVVAKLPKSTPAVWATNKSMSESLESDDDVEVPRVLIHQDNSDQYESTLIIAVTRPAPPAPTAVIKEILPKVKPKPKSEWIPNKNAISSFLEMTPSPPSSQHHLDVNRGHFRKRSMDSNDSDSWIPENFRNKSCTSSSSTGLNKINESSEPWKVHSVFSEEKLYKTRSIDIFSNRESSAFQDFEEEMRNVPVRRITATSADSLNKSFGESTDDDDDYDNASRITRVKRPSPMVSSTKAAIETLRSDSVNTKGSIDSNKAYHGSPFAAKKGQIGNSQESLDANYDENEQISTDDEDGPPTMAPSPPPSFSPPPPPLPLRKPPRNIPERNDSMVRLAKPLVKQASLRRHFSEEIEPSDLGKVNKLICRFEKNPSQESVQKIQTNTDDSNETDDDVEEKKPPKSKDDSKDIKNGNKKRPAPVPKQPVVTLKVEDSINNNSEPQGTPTIPPEIISSNNLDNISLAQSPTSEYGSPIGSMCLSERTISEYGSPIGVAYPTRTMDQLHTVRRLSNRSSLRDDDTFYSFESDEENNFYSFGESSTSSTRYTIEI